MSIANIDLNLLVDADDLEAQQICGVAHLKAARKAMLRKARAGMPHRKFEKLIVFYKPLLHIYMTQKTKARKQVNSGKATCNHAGNQ